MMIIHWWGIVDITVEFICETINDVNTVNKNFIGYLNYLLR